MPVWGGPNSGTGTGSGTFLLVETNSVDTLEDNMNPVEWG